MIVFMVNVIVTKRRLAMNKKLARQIEKQLETLKKLIQKLANHDIHPDDPDL
jgi:hypothetical protein